LRTKSTPALARKTDTLNPAVSDPLARVKATEDISESIPCEINKTKSFTFSDIAFSSYRVEAAMCPDCCRGRFPFAALDMDRQ
jgi:hypothetical protein